MLVSTSRGSRRYWNARKTPSPRVPRGVQDRAGPLAVEGHKGLRSRSVTLRRRDAASVLLCRCRGAHDCHDFALFRVRVDAFENLFVLPLRNIFDFERDGSSIQFLVSGVNIVLRAKKVVIQAMPFDHLPVQIVVAYAGLLIIIARRPTLPGFNKNCG